jgi:hypothetical protein
MSAVELSLQLQIQDIAAVKASFAAALVTRSPDTLWWLVDGSDSITYENRVKGSSILAIDQNVGKVNIASLYSDWFNLQNAYFSQDQPIVTPAGVSSLKTAIEIYYRWRVSQYFNDIMSVSGGQGLSPQYVFPYPDFNLFSYDGAAWTKGNGPVDLAVTGPGILGVIPIGADTASAITLTNLTAVYPDPADAAVSTVVFPSVSVPSGSLAGVAVPVGKQQLTAAYTLTDGVIAVAATLGFKVGAPVVIAENTPGSDTALPVLKYETAEVAVMSGTSLTLRQVTPPGGTAAANGLRNQYTTAAFVYPLFKDVTAVTGGSGQLQIGFYPDYPQGFVDVTSIVTPQVEGLSLAVEQVAAEGEGAGDLSPSPPPSPTSTRSSPSARSSHSPPSSPPGRSAEKL